MKKKIYLCFAVGIIILLMPSLSIAYTPPSGSPVQPEVTSSAYFINYLRNPSFEQGLDWWYGYPVEPQLASYPVYDGQLSAYLCYDCKRFSDDLLFYQYTSTPLSLRWRAFLYMWIEEWDGSYGSLERNVTFGVREYDLNYVVGIKIGHNGIIRKIYWSSPSVGYSISLEYQLPYRQWVRLLIISSSSGVYYYVNDELIGQLPPMPSSTQLNEFYVFLPSYSWISFYIDTTGFGVVETR